MGVSRRDGGEILYCNERLADIVGLPPQALVGRRTPDFYANPNDRNEILEELSTQGRVREREVQLRTHDGSICWAIVTVEPLEVDGETLLLSALFNVTRRREVENQLQESEARFRSYVENASDIVFACDRKLELTYVSPNVEQIIGYPATRMIGKTLDSLVHKADVPTLWARADATNESRRAQPPLEFRMRHGDGSIRWFVSALAPLQGPDGKVMSLTGTAHDITQEKSAIASLEAANRELRDAQMQLLESEKMASLGMLMAGIAHEIRTPIAAVGSTQCTIERALHKLEGHLRDRYPDVMQDRKVQRLLGVLAESTGVVGDGSTRVLEIVKRLRKFSCADQTQRITVDVNAIAEDTLALLHHELKHHVEIEQDFAPEAQVVGSPSRLNQVFVNLLVNAGHAIRARGRGHIRLSTRAFAEHVEICVQDDGVGIAPEHLEQVFASGFTTKKSEGGSGLGLAISREIVEAHHGRMEVTSQLGEGTTFTVWLPRKPPNRSTSTCPKAARNDEG